MVTAAEDTPPVKQRAARKLSGASARSIPIHRRVRIRPLLIHRFPVRVMDKRKGFSAIMRLAEVDQLLVQLGQDLTDDLAHLVGRKCFAPLGVGHLL